MAIFVRSGISLMVALIITIGFISYVCLLMMLIRGWNIAWGPSNVRDDQPHGWDPRVSVIVAARNESTRIPFLVEDLRAQQYKNFEVIIVDDHSHDNTAKVCRDAIAGDPRFTIACAHGAGKKSALTQAVGMAQGDIILATDADCRLGTGWVQSMSKPFNDVSVMFCIGNVAITGNGVFDRLQAIEFSALVGTGIATAALGVPTMCNGASMAYRKEAFIHVDGYNGNEMIASGDDEFLMQKIFHAFPVSIRCCSDASAVVTTPGSARLTDFVAQRLRWAGKWKANSSVFSRLIALFIFCFHLCVLCLPVALLLDLVSPILLLTCFFLKASAELLLLSQLRPIRRVSWSWAAFFMLQVIHSYYVVFVAVSAQFAGFEWKGRRVKPLIFSGH